MVNKGSSFADFVRLHTYTYARTQWSLPPLWAVINSAFCFALVCVIIGSIYFKTTVKLSHCAYCHLQRTMIMLYISALKLQFLKDKT